MAVYLKRFKTHEEEIQSLCKDNITTQPTPLVTFTDDCEEVRYPKGFNKVEDTFNNLTFIRESGDTHTMVYNWSTKRTQYFNKYPMILFFCGKNETPMGGQARYVKTGMCDGDFINEKQFIKVIYDDDANRHFEVLTENGVYEDDNLYVKLERTLKEEVETETVSGGTTLPGVINPIEGPGSGFGGGTGLKFNTYYYYTNIIKITITFKNEEIETPETTATLQFLTAENEEEIIECE